jgi:hypothetical protein
MGNAAMTRHRVLQHLLLATCLLPLSLQARLHHRLEVQLNPQQHSIVVINTITRTDTAATDLEFQLHPDLTPELVGSAGRLETLPAQAGGELSTLNISSHNAGLVPRRYRVVLPAGQERFVLRYQGRIHHALRQQGGEYARGFRETSGMIAAQGVFLAGQSYWYPHVEGERVSFELHVQLPSGWNGMTQGERLLREADERVEEHWHCASPQEEIYLIAGRFSEYTRKTNGVEAMVLLREPDAALAQQYLDATAEYVRLYSDLIGPYPYRKFALVENFWETGYGMPSFTLLGPKVIRFPFILHSSYPHEILHNWWGNSVYVDYESGNWAEGLTSYLADHLIKEQRGQGADYRRGVLQKYTDHVRHQQEFPLVAFRGRHSAVSEAVGYGKTLMLFHMLRRQLGDAVFREGLQALYRQQRFQVTGFTDVEAVFSTVAGYPLHKFFEQWVERSGAPSLRVSDASARREGERNLLTAVIEQTQPGPAYTLRVPLAVQLEGEETAWQTELLLDNKAMNLELELPAAPLRLDIDPEFDVFRRLDRNEIPPAISQAMGADRVMMVLPAAAPAALLAAYEALAAAWQAGDPDRFSHAMDRDLEKLPDDRAVWLFGWDNRFRKQPVHALTGYAFSDAGDTLMIAGTPLSRSQHAVVVMARHPGNPDQALGWLAADEPAALAGLGRKLPHYGRYSYLAFSGSGPDNVLKGQWPVLDSPLLVTLADASGPARLAPRTPLAAPQTLFSTTRMQRDIALLASESLQGRGPGTPGLDRAADYLAAQFKAAGLQPGAAGGDAFLQSWEVPGDESRPGAMLKNIIGILPGNDPRRAGESLVIGAHYDHLGYGETGARAEDRGRLHPGADDNASGVAVMLELARALAGQPRPRSIVFVAFTGEETGRQGSRHYLEQAAAVGYPVEKMIAMLNLDTVGRLGEQPLTVFGTGTADEWVHILRGAGYVTGVPVRQLADDIGSSDQTSFIAAGVPAVQFFSGAHADFHRPGDTPEAIDAAGLVKVARVLKETADYLARRPRPLSAMPGGTQQGIAATAAETPRRVSLGTLPDYGWSGAGVRLDGVDTGTPAAQAGLEAGDVILELNETAVNNLRDYSRALKQLTPGDELRIRYRRNDAEARTTARVVER